MNQVVTLKPEDRLAYDRITVTPVTPVIGAEISGVDLSRPLDAETFAEVRKALNHWRVVFFRDQDLSNEALKAFGRQFGPLTPAHPIADGLQEHPEIWERQIDEYRTAARATKRCRPAASRRATTRAGTSTSPSWPTPTAIRSSTAR
jgi:taurine dioxygenase